MALRLIGRKFIGFEKALERQAQAFAEIGGTEVELHFLETKELYQRMVAGDGCTSGEYDLFLTVTDWYPTLIARSAVRGLNAFIEQEPPPDWRSGWPASLLSLQRDEGGELFGMPYHDGPEMLIYRRDLFESEAEKQLFSETVGGPLEPPRTWSQFLKVARFFTRPKDELYGTVLATFPDAHNIIYDFALQLFTRGGQLLDDAENPCFQGETGVKSLSYLRDLTHRYKVTPPDGEMVDSVRSGEIFAAGKVAMMVNWLGFAAFADVHESSAVRGQVGSGLVPAGDGRRAQAASLNIYWCLAIPTGSSKAEEAYRFIRHCAAPAMDLITSDEGGIGARRSTWTEYAQRGVTGYDIMEELHARARHMPRIRNIGRVSAILNEHLDRALNKGADIEAELECAADRCAEVGRA
ncbi:MAG: extracellular solute-binding protein [Candidatus Latescibacterota bacterium]|nr:extracellular solute-binding protein [Candidatus Latescibacterota bacterium]